MKDALVVNSKNSRIVYIAAVNKLCDEHPYLTFPPPRIGEERSLGQGALVHIWLRAIIARYLNKRPEEVTEAELEGIKRTMKALFYSDTGASWMVHEVLDYDSMKNKKVFRSTSNYKRGEMFVFMTWMQALAAMDGFLLESKGQYAKNQREQNA